jgi:HK97 family phage major capsid protein/HK97 family phage prohead protease
MMATDFPGKGDDQKITLRNSEYPQFDREFAENIAEFNSEVGEERMEHEDERPYPNEHAARINDSEKYDEFRRQANVGGEGIDFIFGIYSVDDERVSEIQSVRFDADRYTMQQALEWLDENDMEPMKFEEAVGERNEKRHIIEITEDDDAILIKFGKGMEFEGINVMPEEVQDDEEMEMEIEVERYLKTETLHRAEAMEADRVDDRRVRMSISSETAVERGYGKEVLDHSRESVDLSFLNSGRAPLLLDHDPERQIGVVESVDLDGDARRLRAVVRFSRNALASEVYDDVVDGIRGNVSIGYRVTKMDRDEGDTLMFRATSWQPLEVSVVSIPADQSVGVGRAHETSPETENPVPVIEEIKMEQSNETVRQEALAAFQKEVGEIIDLAVRHNQRSLADEAIRKGLNLAQFRGLLLEKIADKPLDAAEIDMSPKEQRQYSLMNAIRSASLGKLNGFEAEVSQELARHYGKDARGFYVPTSIFKRDILTTSPTNGSNLVPEDHLGGEFIDALRANLVISGLGARMMQGLKGDVAIPALNAKTTVGFVGENAAPGSEGAPTFRQVTMTPKELRQYVDISRKLMMQSDPSVEQIIREDLTRQFAAKIDEVAIEGAGANEPTGILETNGIGSVTLGTNGGAITYASLIDLEKEVAIDNALNGSLHFLTNPKVVGEMRQTPRQNSGVEGNFILNDSNTVLGYNVASTTLVPSDLTKGTSSGVCSAVLFGNFQDLMIGMFGGLDILVDPYSGSDKGATRIAMYQDVDVAVRHAESFAAIKDVTTV